MLLENNRLILKLLLFFVLFTCQTLTGQQLHHLQGELLVTLKPAAKLDSFLAAHQYTQGKASHLRLFKKLNSPVSIYRLRFNFDQIDEQLMLRAVQEDPRIQVAQFNHLVRERIAPNDPLFFNQWQYLNTANPAADMDAPAAWDITTGGTNFDGDTIVVCIIDDGTDINHTDFGNNLWRNQQEIPNNGIDDDNNGYVDDYRGWNVHEQNDMIQTVEDNGIHGTPIMGIIGAKANNQIGVSGVNWNVKLMVVVGFANEAEVLEAYAYPHQLRKRFNESGGTEGALVVATNSSWGTAFGQASEAPLWCSFYDTLGQAGILSAGATVNGNYDIDIVGDLPTSCNSEYLISVTNLDNNGNKVNAAGYGAEHIDLGAFGEQVFTTTLNNSYGTFYGTSAATPQVAGAIALLYAAPCPSLASLSKIDPPFAASIVKEFILNGTSPNPSLVGITQTEGSLNLKQSLDLVMDHCDFGDCSYPYAIEITNITDQSIQLNWSVFNIVSSSNVRYRMVGTSDWTELVGLAAPQVISNLSSCSDYEVQVKAICANGESVYSESVHFQTEGCCLPPTGFMLGNLTQSSAILNWKSLFDATSYELRYRVQDSMSWTIIPSTTNYNLLINLEPCTAYEVSVQGICSNGTPTGFTEILNFKTLGCPNCEALDYCEVAGTNDGNTWISKIQINQLSNESGVENGLYSDFTGYSTNLVLGDYQIIDIKTDYQFFEALSYFSVWIDFNQDGDFTDEHEKVLQTNNPTMNINSAIYIPSSASIGSTRMRVAARTGIVSDPCETSDEGGEVEDYCVDILSPMGCIAPYFLNCAHSETKSFLSWACNIDVDSFGIRYRSFGEGSWNYVTTTNYYYTLEDLSPCTNYEYQVHSICGLVESVYSPASSFKTKGCGACLDYNYCKVENINANFEWIESIRINGILNSSGGDAGYGNFSSFIYNFNTEVAYDFELQPGFPNPNSTDLEYFMIWIDLNQDGDFKDANELIFDQGVALNTFPVVGNFTLPSTALEGSTRMRVAMKYNAAPSTACESDFSGEIEDYCINIYHQQNNVCAAPLALNANYIGEDFIELSWENTNMDIVSYRLLYRESNTLVWKSIYTAAQEFRLSGLSECTGYDFRVSGICTSGLSSVSVTKSLLTECFSTSTADVSKQTIKVFPNPFLDYLNVEIPETIAGTIQINLRNTAGQSVYQKTIHATSATIALPLPTRLANGIYFLQVQTNSTQFTQKLLKLALN